jgi:RimJ/RimL family protein N-acetyltransferase
MLVVPATSTGPALVLRLWTDSDADSLVEVYRDPAIRRWIQTPVTNPTEAAAWLAAQQDGWRTGDRLSFAVHDDERRLVACVVLKKPRSAPEVGYWTAAQARGLGVATRAVDALSEWAFATHGLARIELRHQVDNVASCRVAEKTGYALKATMPATPPFPLDGHLHVRHAT